MQRENEMTDEELDEAVQRAYRQLFSGPAPPPKKPEPTEEEIQEASRVLFGGEGRRLEDIAGGGR